MHTKHTQVVSYDFLDEELLLLPSTFNELGMPRVSFPDICVLYFALQGKQVTSALGDRLGGSWYDHTNSMQKTLSGVCGSFL